ncbi:MAG TPA: site-specific DNA-methyltransferase [Chthonomonadales bacterium]|nr:site-specific DNA-methyltransferase [Chthonomonadales bacterium]
MAVFEDMEEERYELIWPGKVAAALGAEGDCGARLASAHGDTSAPSKIQCTLIQGDNLQALKLLQETLSDQVRLIYIDPPYNSGKEYVFSDRFSAGKAAKAAAGCEKRPSAHRSSRLHAAWLSMIYPRLILARRLLRADGAIFISIDDHEAARLRLLCDEVFGEGNFVACIVWHRKYTRSNDARHFSVNHDYILVYAKQKRNLALNPLQRTKLQSGAYSNPDNHPKGPWKPTPLHAKSGRQKHFTYRFANGAEWSPPPGTFPRYTAQRLAALEARNEIWFGVSGRAVPARKSFLCEVKAGLTPVTIWPHAEVGHTHEANNELKALGLTGLFQNPKPTRLIRRILELATCSRRGDLVLDFFAGSGATGQAVIEQNLQDGGNRRVILVQDTVAMAGAGFETIADLTRERLRRSIQRGCPAPGDPGNNDAIAVLQVEPLA